MGHDFLSTFFRSIWLNLGQLIVEFIQWIQGKIVNTVLIVNTGHTESVGIAQIDLLLLLNVTVYLFWMHAIVQLVDMVRKLDVDYFGYFLATGGQKLDRQVEILSFSLQKVSNPEHYCFRLCAFDLKRQPLKLFFVI